MNDFELKKDKWLKEVADGCHKLAIMDENNPDFYVFFSSIPDKYYFSI